jgi:SAM-dependent methyltransferase
MVPWMPSAPLYDRLGHTYAVTRREDPRVAAQIWAALGPGRSVLNVGAGTGSYEPRDRTVVALEPSPAMIGQRAQATRLVVRGVAEQLPFADAMFDAALAVLTVHHWADREAGLLELRRVSRRQVVLFFEPLQVHGFWALEYFEEAKELPSERDAPGEPLLRRLLPVREVQRVLVPRDCVDGFGAAFWARPEAYLDPVVQAGMSWMALLPEAVRARGTERLRRDLASGAWDAEHGHLRSTGTYDAGYRLAVAEDPGGRGAARGGPPSGGRTLA